MSRDKKKEANPGIKKGPSDYQSSKKGASKADLVIVPNTGKNGK